MLKGDAYERLEYFDRIAMIVFVYGDIAMLAELQGNDQERHMPCGGCAAG